MATSTDKIRKMCNHPGYYVVIEAEIYGRVEKNPDVNVLNLRPDILANPENVTTVWQARAIQCMHPEHAAGGGIYQLNPAYIKKETKHDPNKN